MFVERSSEAKQKEIPIEEIQKEVEKVMENYWFTILNIKANFK